ncbi:carbohydrate binding domain-containing protein [Treponema pectinovorum]|uniref:carbohydrate binding domain-containing protein n=1 Tax=Treponema pectinovorum TaxID=164 RepID=UPI0011CC74A5|nr:hypothetical protein [Treponema pectinovorum]
MTDYPFDVIKEFATKKITKENFINAFADWQKMQGLDFDCKGVSVGKHIGVTYRAKLAVIKKGELCFYCVSVSKKGRKKIQEVRVKSIFEFRRKVDFLIFEEKRDLKWI